MNPADGVPETFWVFVDQSNPMTWNNFNLVGTIFSSPASSDTALPPYIRNPDWEPGFLSPFLVSSLAPWGVELDAELARRQLAPTAPSRLTSVYAFGSLDDCHIASRLYSWNLGEVHPFTIAPREGARVAKVNMEIVSLARDIYSRGGPGPDVSGPLWAAYWGGKDNFAVEVAAPAPTLRSVRNSGCLWEYLIDGHLVRA